MNPCACSYGGQGGVSFFGVLGCLAGLAQSGAITYQAATNSGVAAAVGAPPQPVYINRGVPFLWVALGGVALYLLLRKK